MSGGKFKESDRLRERILKVGLDIKFDDRHYSRAHRDIKDLINLLVTVLESDKVGLTFTTPELEYMVYHLRGVNKPVVSKLVGKLLNEIRRRDLAEG